MINFIVAFEWSVQILKSVVEFFKRYIANKYMNLWCKQGLFHVFCLNLLSTVVKLVYFSPH